MKDASALKWSEFDQVKQLFIHKPVFINYFTYSNNTFENNMGHREAQPIN